MFYVQCVYTVNFTEINILVKSAYLQIVQRWNVQIVHYGKMFIKKGGSKHSVISFRDRIGSIIIYKCIM